MCTGGWTSCIGGQNRGPWWCTQWPTGCYNLGQSVSEPIPLLLSILPTLTLITTYAAKPANKGYRWSICTSLYFIQAIQCRLVSDKNVLHSKNVLLEMDSIPWTEVCRIAELVSLINNVLLAVLWPTSPVQGFGVLVKGQCTCSDKAKASGWTVKQTIAPGFLMLTFCIFHWDCITVRRFAESHHHTYLATPKCPKINLQ